MQLLKHADSSHKWHAGIAVLLLQLQKNCFAFKQWFRFQSLECAIVHVWDTSVMPVLIWCLHLCLIFSFFNDQFVLQQKTSTEKGHKDCLTWEEVSHCVCIVAPCHWYVETKPHMTLFMVFVPLLSVSKSTHFLEVAVTLVEASCFCKINR